MGDNSRLKPWPWQLRGAYYELQQVTEIISERLAELWQSFTKKNNLTVEANLPILIAEVKKIKIILEAYDADKRQMKGRGAYWANKAVSQIDFASGELAKLLRLAYEEHKKGGKRNRQLVAVYLEQALMEVAPRMELALSKGPEPQKPRTQPQKDPALTLPDGSIWMVVDDD